MNKKKKKQEKNYRKTRAEGGKSSTIKGKEGQWQGWLERTSVYTSLVTVLRDGRSHDQPSMTLEYVDMDATI